MHHTTDDDLILYFYGEAGAAVGEHVDSCPDCRSQYQRLQRVLNVVEMPVPERAADYEAKVWSRLEGKLGVRRYWLAPQRWIAIAALASLVVVAFMAGRYSSTVAPPVADTSVGERVLRVAVGDHLERSQMVLAELINAETRQGRVNFEMERSLAETLLTPNRLYRQTAMTAGDSATAALLEDLERVLLEIAHSPEVLESTELDALRERVEQQGLLFRVRVTGSQMRERLDESQQVSETL